MPIPIAKLEEAQRPMTDRVFDVLQRDRTQAYSAWDVACAVLGEQNLESLVLQSDSVFDDTMEPVISALAELVGQERAQRGIVDGVPYFYVSRKP